LIRVATYNDATTQQLTCYSGIFFFVGPVLLIFAMVFEWIMGNFFPMMVMGLFAVSNPLPITTAAR